MLFWKAGTGVGKSAIGVCVSRFIKYFNKLNKISHKLTEDNVVYQNLKKDQEKNQLNSKLSQYKSKKTNQINTQIKLENNNLDVLTYLNSSYFLTTQKILQQQYVKDFGSMLKSPRKIRDIEDYCSLSNENNFFCNKL